ncbi:MAG: hypothetical protein EAX91_16715 [Candidatus Lokiarchaeota archaeon]|nr:hypothetical protein [Candidatus Lokiarchaeota archaeon]
MNSEHKQLLTQYLNELSSMYIVPRVVNIDELHGLSWEENINKIKQINEAGLKASVFKKLIATIKQTELMKIYKTPIESVFSDTLDSILSYDRDKVNAIATSTIPDKDAALYSLIYQHRDANFHELISGTKDTYLIERFSSHIKTIIIESLKEIEQPPISFFKMLRLWSIVRTIQEVGLMESYLQQVEQIFLKGFKTLETEMDISKKLTLYTGIIFAMKDTKFADLFLTQANMWYSSLFQATRNTRLFLELAQAIKYNPKLVSEHFEDFLIRIKELSPLTRRLESLSRFLYIIKLDFEQILDSKIADSPLLKETIEPILASIEQRPDSDSLGDLLIMLKPPSLINGYSSRIKPLLSHILTNIEADNRVESYELYHLMYGVKGTPLMDYCFPRFERLFLKMLENLKDIPPEDLDFYLDSEEFPNFYDVVKDTNLDKVLNEFYTKLDKQLIELKSKKKDNNKKENE